MANGHTCISTLTLCTNQANRTVALGARGWRLEHTDALQSYVFFFLPTSQESADRLYLTSQSKMRYNECGTREGRGEKRRIELTRLGRARCRISRSCTILDIVNRAFLKKSAQITHPTPTLSDNGHGNCAGHTLLATLPFFSSSGSLSFMIHNSRVAPRLLSSSGVRDLKNQSNLNQDQYPFPHGWYQGKLGTYLNRGHSPISLLINS